jgi:hypothetical protein
MMGAMSQDQQAHGVAPAGVPEVVQWGGEESPARPARTPQRSLAALASDRRLVPTAAALGAVALFGSLISEWQITAIDGTAFGAGEVGPRPVAVGIADLGAWGGGYLAGLFLLVAATVVMLFGPPAGRVYARLAALSCGGVLLALLAALLTELGDTSRALSYATVLTLEADQIALTSGRGGYCAVAGVLAVLLAAVLAGRHLPDGRPTAVTSAGPRAGTPEGAAAGAPEGAAQPAGDWPWRPPGPADDPDDDGSPAQPFELTVSPADPFTSLGDARDTYRRPDSISG